ncbi:MAG: hypothetical protein NTX25_07785 [Proteobacteria bacterium]|nr:hypothetical protein [Pseudomonadota bacterium]
MHKKQTLTARASQLPKAPAQALPIPSRMALLDEFLGGGLAWGELSEWGLPWGAGLRDLILPFLASAQHETQQATWILWIYGQKDVQINPLAWHSRGINLEKLRFSTSLRPLVEFKPLFLSNFFRIIVLDSISNLSSGDYAFLARQARSQQQHIMILHPSDLSNSQGNIWARLRLNCWRDFSQQRAFITLLKGRQQRQFSLPLTNLD